MENQRNLSDPLTLRLPSDVLAEIEEVARISGRSRSWVMVRAMKAYLAGEGREVVFLTQRAGAAHPAIRVLTSADHRAPAEEVHHILPLSKGGGSNAENLMALCKSCHSRITAESGDRWGR